MCNHLFDWQLYYRIIVFLDRPYFVHVILCIEVLPLALWRYICLPLEYLCHTLEVRQFVTNTWKTYDAKGNRRLSKDRVLWLVLLFISCIHKRYTYICKKWLPFETVIGVWNFSAVFQNVCFYKINVWSRWNMCSPPPFFCICIRICFSLNKLKKNRHMYIKIVWRKESPYVKGKCYLALLLIFCKTKKRICKKWLPVETDPGDWKFSAVLKNVVFINEMTAVCVKL